MERHNEKHWRRTLQKKAIFPGISGLLGVSVLRTVGMNLVGLFIPIYVYQVTGGLNGVVWFFSLIHLTIVFFGYLAGRLVKKIGVDLSVLAGSVGRAVTLLLLIFSRSVPELMWVAAIVWGMAIPVYWTAFHYSIYGLDDGDGQFGKETSWLRMGDRVAIILAPIVGGLLANWVGFENLFIVALVVVALAGLPQFFDKFSQKQMRFSFKGLLSQFKKPKNRRYLAGFLGAGIKDTVIVAVWPIFLYLVIKDFVVMGSLQAGAQLVSLLLAWWIGKTIDKKQKSKQVMQTGAFINSINWVARGFLTTPWTIFISETVHTWGELMVWESFDAGVYQGLAKKHKLEFLTFREMTIHSGRILGLVLVWALWQLGLDWIWFFVLVSLSLSLVSFGAAEVALEEASE